MSDSEIAGLRSKVKTYTVDELTMIYRYATDRERVLVLLALNCGFAQAELGSLRRDEVHLDGQPNIDRIRRKTRVAARFALWAETVKALEWIMPQSAGELAILTERGQPMQSQHIANQWRRLVGRIRADDKTKDFRFLPFKHLRKTAGQFVRDAADGEIAGVFLAHGQPVRSDELSDVYTNRPFAKVAEALAKVHDRLAPMFAAAPADSFTAPRKRGGTKVSRGTVDRIQQLAQEGMNPTLIAKTTGLSRPTVYRHLRTAAAATP
jgi:hypothetical protein